MNEELANSQSYTAWDYVERMKEHHSNLVERSECEIKKQLQENILLASQNLLETGYGKSFVAALAPLVSDAFVRPYDDRESDFQRKLVHYFRQNASNLVSDDVVINWIEVNYL